MPQGNHCTRFITFIYKKFLYVTLCSHYVTLCFSYRDPKFVRKFWQSFIGKLNTKIKMSNARHPRADGLTERANLDMQTLLRYYCADSAFDWTSH